MVGESLSHTLALVRCEQGARTLQARQTSIGEYMQRIIDRPQAAQTFEVTHLAELALNTLTGVKRHRD